MSRYVGDGLHEDVDLTNYSEHPTRFTLALEVDADFADIDETKGDRRQRGSLERAWRDAAEDAWELGFDYRAEHTYDHPRRRRGRPRPSSHTFRRCSASTLTRRSGCCS